ncbi:DUF4145 domain-containing protein [Nonlabens marinus]|uniref:DUF4145 domain-containing protein n=1 Tax=Nonlabens marinus S1-08 TaxID=1454201 RepID=W8VVH6_9FLAO|nr:DUF4145 domain-containing protein [Nonlabens marinus]BAO55453.1 hypothetical protein NMS_1444 [Nonlabens marinus S1-08]
MSGKTFKCPICKSVNTSPWNVSVMGSDNTYTTLLEDSKCAECGQFVVRVRKTGVSHTIIGKVDVPDLEEFIYPVVQTVIDQQHVPENIYNDYIEAKEILGISNKGSAAVSRGLLQLILRDYYDVTHSNLAAEIKQAIDSNKLPTYLADEIDAIRMIGNFAAHPSKSLNTGIVVPVEPNEAEWLIAIIEGLLECTFIAPALQRKRISRLNDKLEDIGKPPMKGRGTKKS